MKHESLTYKQYRRRKKAVLEVGSKAWVTNKMFKAYNDKMPKLIELISSQLAKQIAIGIVKRGGEQPRATHIWEEEDKSLRVNEYGAVVEAIPGDRASQYVAMAYHSWAEAIILLNEWEERSLSDYLLHWLSQKRRSSKVRQKVYAFLDSIEPDWREEA